jgi:hypothetical protein
MSEVYFETFQSLRVTNIVKSWGFKLRMIKVKKNQGYCKIKNAYFKAIYHVCITLLEYPMNVPLSQVVCVSIRERIPPPVPLVR